MYHKILFFFRPFKNIKPFLAHSLYKNRWWAKFGPSLKGSQSQALAHGFFFFGTGNIIFFLRVPAYTTLVSAPRTMLHRRPRLPQNPKTEEWHESGGKHLPEYESMVVPWGEHEFYSHTDPPATIQPLAAQGRALDLGLPCPGLRFPHLQSTESLSNGLDLLCGLKRHYTKYLGHGP